jgi:DNA-directed RNA polymerase subunit E'/Rpb7
MNNEPYILTNLEGKVSIQPNQMNNNIKKFLKENIQKKYTGKNLGNYGYIVKIISIVDYSGGNIIPEDTRSSAIFSVVFSCKLCRPLRETFMTFSIQEINMAMIKLVNGPILLVCFPRLYTTINKETFIVDDKKKIIQGIDSKTGEKITLVEGIHVRVKINSMKIADNQDIIYVHGFIDRLATQEEITNSVNIRESDEINYKKFNEYAKSEFELDNYVDNSSLSSDNEAESVEETNSDY